MSKISVTLEDARRKAEEIHFGHLLGSETAPGQHVADELVSDLLYSALVDTHDRTRSSRSAKLDARSLWNPESDNTLAAQVNKMYEDEVEPQDEVDARLAKAGIFTFEDQYTAERVRNLKSEVLSRVVEGLIVPQTNIVNNFFRTVRHDAADTLGQLREYVTVYETYSDWEYYQIDPNRGDIRSIELNMAQHSERVNAVMQTYGVKIEYENYLHRVLPNVSIADILAMVVVGWAKASAMAREFDASKFLTNYLAPAPVFSNNENSHSALGQLSGVGINGIQNGTFDMDYDFPRMLDHMENELGMSTNNLIMLLPRNAWAFMNTRQGYRRFLGIDGQPLYQRPQFVPGPKGAGADDDRFGIRNKGIGFRSPQQAANYLTGTRHGNAARAGEQMVPGPMPFLPEQVPNWMNTFFLPNSAFGPMRVVLTPFAQAEHRFYAEGHELRKDAVTKAPRPIMTTDIMFFDANHPLWLVESIPPTSWTATNDEYRKSVMVMVEAYAMANSARGQQAAVIEGAVLDNNYTHDISLNAKDIAITDQPLDGGLAKE